MNKAAGSRKTSRDPVGVLLNPPLKLLPAIPSQHIESSRFQLRNVVMFSPGGLDY